MQRAIELETDCLTLDASQLCGTRDRSGIFPNKRKIHLPRARVRVAPTFHSLRIEPIFEVGSKYFRRACLVEIA
jgi:hypothetical protein